MCQKILLSRLLHDIQLLPLDLLQFFLGGFSLGFDSIR